LASSVFVGLDAGTTGVKATAFLEDGRDVASVRAELPMRSPVPGAAEQDPDHFVMTCLDVLAQCVQAVNGQGRSIAAIGLSGIIGSLVVLDRQMHPLGMAFTWADLRCSPQVEEAIEALDHDSVYFRTGCQIHSIYTGPKIAWLARRDPERFAAGRWFVPLKSYLLLKLTGSLLLDRSVGSGSGMLDITGLSWNDDWLQFLGVDPGSLGELVESDHRCRLTAEAADRLGVARATPLVVGAADGMLSSLGVGAVGEGVYTAMIATSAACRTVATRPILHPRRATWSYYLADGLWVNGGAISSAGIVYRWVRDTLFADRADPDDYSPVNAAAQAAPAGAEGLLMLPFLAGERSPNWDVNARGALLGMTLGHDRGHIARAAMESICLHLAQVMSALREICTSPRQVRTTGGFRGSSFWVQMLCDCLDTPLALPQEGDASVLGAAMLAMRAEGAMSSLLDAPKLVPIVGEVRPDRSASDHFARQLERYEDLYATLKPQFAGLAG
jgi:gluconokinase